jgi:hypothetical protein
MSFKSVITFDTGLFFAAASSNVSWEPEADKANNTRVNWNIFIAGVMAQRSQMAID